MQHISNHQQGCNSFPTTSTTVCFVVCKIFLKNECKVCKQSHAALSFSHSFKTVCLFVVEASKGQCRILAITSRPAISPPTSQTPCCGLSCGDFLFKKSPNKEKQVTGQDEVTNCHVLHKSLKMHLSSSPDEEKKMKNPPGGDNASGGRVNAIKSPPRAALTFGQFRIF